MTSFAAPRLNLRAMGFCGVDDSVSPELLQLLSVHYSWIEWGFLFRPDLEGQPRYPTSEYVRRLCKINSDTGGLMRLAGHLCGARCQEVIDGDSNFVRELKLLGFGRVQINITAANNVIIDQTKIDIYVANLRTCMSSVPEIEWIMQCNSETQEIVASLTKSPPRNMSLLYDASCGLGVEISEFPAPITDPVYIKCGYAGGIGPLNIRDVLHKVTQSANNHPVWVDMESSLRVRVTGKSAQDKDVFSVDKCFACILAGTTDFGLPVSRFTLLSI